MWDGVIFQKKIKFSDITRIVGMTAYGDYVHIYATDGESSYKAIYDPINDDEQPGSIRNFGKMEFLSAISDGNVDIVVTDGDDIYQSSGLQIQPYMKYERNIYQEPRNYTSTIGSQNGKLLTASLIKGKYVYCHGSDWKCRISETEIFKKCEKIVENWAFPEDVMRQVDCIQNNLFAEFRAILEEKKELEKQLKDMEKQNFNLAKIFTMGKIDKKMLDAQNRELSNDRMKIVEKLESFTALGMVDLEKYQKIIELVKNLIVVYKNEDSVQKGLILRNVIIELQVDEEKLLKIKKRAFLLALFAQCPVWSG